MHSEDEEFMQSRNSIYDVSSKRFCMYFVISKKGGYDQEWEMGVAGTMGNAEGEMETTVLEQQ